VVKAGHLLFLVEAAVLGLHHLEWVVLLVLGTKVDQLVLMLLVETLLPQTLVLAALAGVAEVMLLSFTQEWAVAVVDIYKF
jgi:hypothetical protein